MHPVRKSSNAGWKVDTRGKGVYIDVDVEDVEDHKYDQWSNIPDLVIEQIYSYLTIEERYYASMVCRSWNRAFYMPYVWSTFLFKDYTLTRRKFNYYMGWEKTFDHLRGQVCLFKVGNHVRRLIVAPMWNFRNLSEFLNMVSFFSEREYLKIKIHSLKFTFSCNMATGAQQDIYGTGGQILDTLKRLMSNLPCLRNLELNDLHLEIKDANHLLDVVCMLCCETLKTLTLINTTRNQFQLLHAGVFINLQVLEISPQNLGDDLVELLGNTRLENLHIVQNSYTEALMVPVSRSSWKECRKNNHRLRVHLRNEGKIRREVMWQENAPVRSIVYNSPYSQVFSDSMLTVIDLYRADIEVYAHKLLPRFHMPHSFNDRSDSIIIMLCRQCPNLHTLMIRELISTATVLLVAHTAQNLRYLYIRKNAIILKSDWPRNPEWSMSFYTWLCSNAHSYENMEREVSKIMGRKWTALTDKQYKLAKLMLHNSPYWGPSP